MEIMKHANPKETINNIIQEIRTDNFNAIKKQ